MTGGSKLARRMAYKKQLEEEYRLANEKINVKGVKKYLGYSFSLEEMLENPYSYEVIDRKKLNKVEEEDEEEAHRKNAAIDETNRATVEDNKRKERLKAIEEENRRREREKLRAIENENQRKEDERLRLEKLERKRLEEEAAANAKMEAEILEIKRMEEEQARLAMEEQLRLERTKKLEEEKKMIEMKELEEIRKLKLEEDARTEETKLSPEEEKSIKDLELEEFEEMKKTEERIKQLELSIASLDDELERFEIERMKGKTKKVMKRMSLVISDTTDDELDNILEQTTVNGFMENEVLWGKYLGKENV